MLCRIDDDDDIDESGGRGRGGGRWMEVWEHARMHATPIAHSWELNAIA
jgi:hypothetical protein